MSFGRNKPTAARARRKDVEDDTTLDPGVAGELNVLVRERRYRNSNDETERQDVSNVVGGSSWAQAPRRKNYLGRMKSAVGDLAHGYWPGQRKRKP